MILLRRLWEALVILEKVLGVNLVEKLFPAYLNVLFRWLHLMGKTYIQFCTGTIIKSYPPTIKRILTSARLVRSYDDTGGMIPNLMIQVHLPGGQMSHGWLNCCDLKYNVAVVNIISVPGIREACIDPELQFGSHSKVVAVGRAFNSGKLMATTGILTNDPSEGFSEELMISTCKISKPGIGGPLVDISGNIVGVNLYDKEKTIFVPVNKLRETAVFPESFWAGVNQGSDSTTEKPKQDPTLASGGTSGGKRQYEEQKPDTENIKGPYKKQKPSTSCNFDSEEPDYVYTEYEHSNFLALPDSHSLPNDGFAKYFFEKLNLRGYPLPVMLEGGLRLLNGFEENFAEDTWNDITKKVALKLSQSVVSLASFRGEKRYFACTGILLGKHKSTTRVLTSASLVRASADANSIAENLEIVVHLPNHELVFGTLQHYDLNYNIAVVAINGFRCCQTAKFQSQEQVEPYGKVVTAIGRVFETGKLMATDGIVSRKKAELDCKLLMVSTCKITKAGIGGPMIDIYGNFIGMNFFGMQRTPYLPGHIILKLLKQFDAKRTVPDQVIGNPNQNRWPVPEPSWHYPSSVFRVYHSRRMNQCSICHPHNVPQDPTRPKDFLLYAVDGACHRSILYDAFYGPNWLPADMSAFLSSNISR